MPREFVEGLGDEIKAVDLEVVMHLLDGVTQPCLDPAVGHRKLHVASVQVLRVGEHKPGGIPKFVAEVAVALNPAQVKADVPPGGGQRGEGKAQRVGAILWNTRGKLAPGGGLDFVLEVGLHHALGALGQQRIQIHAVDNVGGIQHVAL